MTSIVHKLAAAFFTCMLLLASQALPAFAADSSKLTLTVTTVASLPTDDGARMLLSTGAQEVLVTSPTTFRVTYDLSSQTDVQAVLDEIRQQPGVIAVEAVEGSQIATTAPAATTDSFPVAAAGGPPPAATDVNWFAVCAAAALTASGLMVLWRSRRRG